MTSCVFRLTGSRFTGDEETLVLAVVDHVAHGAVGKGKDVRCVLLPPSFSLYAATMAPVKWKRAIWLTATRKRP